MKPKTTEAKEAKYLNVMARRFTNPVLDFNDPWPLPLSDPDKFAVQLDSLASQYVERVGVEGRFIDYLPYRNQIPEDKRALIDSGIDWLCATMRQIQGMAALFQPKESTEFGRCRAIIPASPRLLILTNSLLERTRRATELDGSVWPKGEAFIGPGEITINESCKVPGNYPFASSSDDLDPRVPFRIATINEMQAAGCALDRIRRLFGSFDIWAKRPKLETCHAMVRAWRNGDLDSEEFLFWFRKDNLGLLGPELDPYIAQILLGMRKEAGELVLPGDMTVVRKRRQTHLDNIPEEEFCGRLVNAARSRRRWQESVKVGRENERVDESEMDSLVNLLPIDSWDDLRKETAIGLAFVQHAERHDTERIGRAAGLTKKESRLLYQQFQGVGSRSDNPSAWDAVYRKRHEIRDAIVSDPKAAFPVPITSPQTVFRELLPSGQWIYSHTANRHLEFDLG